MGAWARERRSQAGVKRVSLGNGGVICGDEGVIEVDDMVHTRTKKEKDFGQIF